AQPMQLAALAEPFAGVVQNLKDVAGAGASAAPAIGTTAASAGVTRRNAIATIAGVGAGALVGRKLGTMLEGLRSGETELGRESVTSSSPPDNVAAVQLNPSIDELTTSFLLDQGVTTTFSKNYASDGVLAPIFTVKGTVKADVNVEFPVTFGWAQDEGQDTSLYDWFGLQVRAENVKSIFVMLDVYRADNVASSNIIHLEATGGDIATERYVQLSTRPEEAIVGPIDQSLRGKVPYAGNITIVPEDTGRDFTVDFLAPQALCSRQYAGQLSDEKKKALNQRAAGALLLGGAAAVTSGLIKGKAKPEDPGAAKKAVMGRRAFIGGGLSAVLGGGVLLSTSTKPEKPAVETLPSKPPVEPEIVTAQPAPSTVSEPEEPAEPSEPEAQPQEQTLPAPESELMREFQEAAKKIHQILDGRVTAMFWDPANINPDEDFRMLVDFGFNEVIVDGYCYVRSDIDDETMGQFIIAAHQAGIRHFKFMMGDSSWPYEGRDSAIQTTTDLCARLADLKASLTEKGNSEAAKIIEGIAIDNEPHVSRQWNFDLGSYCSLHNKLGQIAKEHGLTYNRIEAFWYSQDRVETGEKLSNYSPPDKNETVYLMSYRNTGEQTFSMASFTGAKHKHSGGFDFVTYAPTGYKGKEKVLPAEFSAYTDLSLQQRSQTFNGAFFHAATIADLRRIFTGYRQSVKLEEQPTAQPQIEQQPAQPKKESLPTPGPGAVKIQQTDRSTVGNITAFTLKITGLTDAQRERAGIVVMKYVSGDAHYSQPTVEQIYDIPADGTVIVEAMAREYQGRTILGKITFYVVDKEVYQPQEFFRSENEIQGVWEKQTATGGQASLKQESEKRLAFLGFVEQSAQRRERIGAAMAQAPMVRWAFGRPVRFAKANTNLAEVAKSAAAGKAGEAGAMGVDEAFKYIMDAADGLTEGMEQ
ncbi:MAG: hypothetical protein HZA83_02340, partial [Thaumarchaeota archaeon]|nr:hypothetical protein [Nitrososphaerota archaeon]